ncbi:hypothetical protein H6F50_05130 [Coleofasciculus sp. FACHB-712]|uniref:baeRF7 domain-containing protein n=1 Tax=Coleofasciculus sp. FACHB-712 TaxID=2692789 RepID=UPI0016884BB0|nr:hypothetical protein [Coleofasciculus sp. FACHB-712]MBD1941744.1 hypothetical protein [Coleofasciculus sp. FACHB-712]
MPLLSTDELKSLIENSASPCISIYMPMEKAGPEIRQNPIRFKNLMREAEQRLEEMGIDHNQAMTWLEQANAIDSPEFWEENQGEGVAIFISPEIFRYYQLPVDVEELVIVSDRFHIKPLLPIVNNDGRFYILALSQKDVRLLQATRTTVKEVHIENLPKSKDEALQYDATSKDGQIRIATSKGGTNNTFQQPGSFHGQGSPDQDDIKKDLLQFFHQIDGALHDFFRNKKGPLVLAGVEYLFPIYKEANTYQHLVEEGITGNPEIFKPEELHELALPIVEPLLQENIEGVVEVYKELAGNDTSKVSHDIKEIIQSAYYHRVDSLFVAVGEQRWGHFDPETMTVDLHPEPQVDDEDMLDFAATHTILNGGKVYAVEPEKVPDEAPVAAIFRY